MATTITNPWAHNGVDWDWDDHLKHGYQGGTDYKGTIGVNIPSPCVGTAYILNDGLNSVAIDTAEGIQINLRELDHRVGTFPRRVKVDEIVGVGGRLGQKFLHVDAIVNGKRVPFETVVTPPATTTASSGSKPLVDSEDEDMVLIEAQGRFWLVKSIGKSPIVELKDKTQIAIAKKVCKNVSFDSAANIAVLQGMLAA